MISDDLEDQGIFVLFDLFSIADHNHATITIPVSYNVLENHLIGFINAMEIIMKYLLLILAAIHFLWNLKKTIVNLLDKQWGPNTLLLHIQIDINNALLTVSMKPQSFIIMYFCHNFLIKHWRVYVNRTIFFHLAVFDAWLLKLSIN